MPLSNPPRDSSGKVIPHNNACILDEDSVIRRISSQYVVDDPKAPTGRKISSMLIRASSGINGGMSIDIKKAIETAGHNAAHYITTPVWIGSILINVGFLRSLPFQVGYDPTISPPPPNPYHGEVWGNFTRAQQKQVLANSTWFTQIANVDLYIQN